MRIKKSIKVKIPPGVSAGSILRVAGEGDAGPRGYVEEITSQKIILSAIGNLDGSDFFLVIGFLLPLVAPQEICMFILMLKMSGEFKGMA